MQKIKYFPYTVSIEEMAEVAEVDNYELGDDFMAMNQMYGGVEFESLILQVLNILDDRQKIIFMYQLLRSTGFGLTQDELCKTVHLSKKKYFFTLHQVRNLVMQVVKYNQPLSSV